MVILVFLLVQCGESHWHLLQQVMVSCSIVFLLRHLNLTARVHDEYLIGIHIHKAITTRISLSIAEAGEQWLSAVRE